MKGEGIGHFVNFLVCCRVLPFLEISISPSKKPKNIKSSFKQRNSVERTFPNLKQSVFGFLVYLNTLTLVFYQMAKSRVIAEMDLSSSARSRRSHKDNNNHFLIIVKKCCIINGTETRRNDSEA